MKLLLFIPLIAIATAEIDLFPPPDLTASPKFRVEVLTPGGWKESYLSFNPARTDGLGASDQPGRSTSWTAFRTDSPVTVRVTRLSGTFTEVKVRPTRFKIISHKKTDTSVEFTLKPSQKISVEFDTDIRQNCFTGPPHGIPCIIDSLLIFADHPPAQDPLALISPDKIAVIQPGCHSNTVPVKNLPDRSADKAKLEIPTGKRVVHFLPGVHDLGYWQVPNTIDHLHFAPGSVVFGAIDVLPKDRQPGKLDLKKTYLDAWFKETLRDDFTITGPGILSGSKLPWHLTKDFAFTENDVYWSHIKLLQIAAKNITLQDLTLVDSPYWVLSFLNDTDKRSRGQFQNFKMLGAWTYNNDGLPVPGGSDSIVRDAFIHANDDAFKLYNSNARIENCTVWQGPNGATFQLGWFAKTVRNVHIKNIDVIHNENWYGVNQSNRALINFADATGQGTIEDFHFENLHIEGKILRLIGLKTGGGQKIQNFHFNNLHLHSLGAGQLGPPGRNYFHGDISNFHFTNFQINNLPITSPTDAQFDFSPQAGKSFTFTP